MTSASWAELPQTEVYPGIARQAIDGERQTLVRYVYQPGSVFPEHRHPEEQITTVLSGRIQFTVNGETITLTAGDVAVIPANVPHGARVIGDLVVETFNALSPRRTAHPAPNARTSEEQT
jgi:quercetin dioxygenase-like cupin family protein